MAALDMPNFFSRAKKKTDPRMDDLLRKSNGNPSAIPDNASTREYLGNATSFASPTDAINAGGYVPPWDNSSGVGPSTYGYRGSYGGGFGRHGGYGGGRGNFSTGRPTARTSDEFYKMRDLEIGNPITELKKHGPDRNFFIDRFTKEAGGVGGVAGAVQGTDAYYAAKGLGPDGKTALEVAPIDAGFGTMMKDGKQVPMTQADFANVKRQSFVKSSFNPTEGADFEAVAQPYQPYTPEPYVYTPQGEDENPGGPKGHTAFEHDDGAARMERRRRDEERAKVDEEMSRGTFTPGTAGGSSFSGSQFFPTAQVGNFFKRTLPKLLPGAFGR